MTLQFHFCSSFIFGIWRISLLWKWLLILFGMSTSKLKVTYDPSTLNRIGDIKIMEMQNLLLALGYSWTGDKYLVLREVFWHGMETIITGWSVLCGVLSCSSIASTDNYRARFESDGWCLVEWVLLTGGLWILHLVMTVMVYYCRVCYLALGCLCIGDEYLALWDVLAWDGRCCYRVAKLMWWVLLLQRSFNK